MRRVKKGPGRRPQSAKRDLFFRLLARGWSPAAARHEVGISRSTSRSWRNGYKVYRNGQVVGFVEGLDPLVEQRVSDRFLSQDERIRIADLRRAGATIRSIAADLERAPSTISRELRRNGRQDRSYRPFEAHRKAATRRRRPRPSRLVTNAALCEFVCDRLAQRWSPQQISLQLRTKYPHDRSMWVCHETLYRAVYQPDSPFRRPSPLAPHRRSPLRTGRDHRRAQQRLDRRRPRFEQPMLTIHERTFAPEDRSEPGHWEGDLIVGKAQQSAIGTLVERHTRTIRLLHLPRRDGDSLHDALLARLGDLPPGLVRSITWDQGTEMARHQRITRSLGVPVYFCDSHSPWQRGSNENSNGLLRDYFPKGTDLSTHNAEHLMAVENELNHRPRRVLQDRAPAELFTALLASEDQPVLRR
jgi:IS30 family transposase